MQGSVGNARISRMVQHKTGPGGALLTGLEPEDAQMLQTALESGELESGGSAPQASLDAMRSSSGGALDNNTRAGMENAFQADFSGVRVHSGSQAAGAAQALNAQAFTHGQDIYFGEGKYQPGTPSGQKLLAHELAHTIQQGGGSPGSASASRTRAPQASLTVSQPGDAHEQEAERASELVTRQAAGHAADQTPLRQREPPQGRLQRVTVEDVFNYLRSGNALVAFIFGVVAGIAEWIADLIVGVAQLAWALVELIAAADSDPLASLGLFGLIILVILAVAFPEVSVPILVVLGVAAGVISLVYHLYMLFNPRLTAYEKGKHLGKAIIEGILLVIAVAEIVQFARAFRTISGLAEGAGAMQKIRWILQLRRLGSLETTLAVVERAGNIERAVELMEITRDADKALRLLGAERNIEVVLELLRTRGAAVDELLTLLEKPGMTGVILRNMLTRADGAARMSLADVTRLLGNPKIADNVALLDSLVRNNKLRNLAQLEELLNNARITNGGQLVDLLSHAKIADGAQLANLLKHAKITGVGQLIDLLNHAKIGSGAELLNLLNDAKLADGIQLGRLLDRYQSGEQLARLLAAPEIAEAAQLERLGEVLARAGFADGLTGGLNDSALLRLATPDILAEIEAAANLQAGGRLAGLVDWIRFNSPKSLPEVRDALNELRDAKRLIDENPGAVIRVGREANAPLRRGTTEPVPEFDISIENRAGTVQRVVESATLEGRVRRFHDVTNKVRHAADKVASRLADGEPLPGAHDALIRMQLDVGEHAVEAGTLRISADGAVDLIAGNGRVIPRENIFTQIGNNIPNIANNALLDRVTLVDQVTGRVLAEFDRFAAAWTRVR